MPTSADDQFIGFAASPTPSGGGGGGEGDHAEALRQLQASAERQDSLIKQLAAKVNGPKPPSVVNPVGGRKEKLAALQAAGAPVHYWDTLKAAKDSSAAAGSAKPPVSVYSAAMLALREVAASSPHSFGWVCTFRARADRAQANSYGTWERRCNCVEKAALGFCAQVGWQTCSGLGGVCTSCPYCYSPAHA